MVLAGAQGVDAQNNIVQPGDTLQANDIIGTGGVYFINGNILPWGTTPFYIYPENLEACYDGTNPVEVKIDGDFDHFTRADGNSVNTPGLIFSYTPTDWSFPGGGTNPFAAGKAFAFGAKSNPRIITDTTMQVSEITGSSVII
jgi:hypothetical protein